MNTTSTELVLPLFFERRESNTNELLSACKRESVEYKQVLETCRGLGPSVFMTSLGGIRVVGPYDLGMMTMRAQQTLEDWKALQAVYSVRASSCSCPCFCFNKFCKHQLAMADFERVNVPTIQHFQPTDPHTPAKDNSSIDSTSQRTPFSTIEVNAPWQRPITDWKSPTSVMLHPQPRKESIWQKRRNLE